MFERRDVLLISYVSVPTDLVHNIISVAIFYTIYVYINRVDTASGFNNPLIIIVNRYRVLLLSPRKISMRYRDWCFATPKNTVIKNIAFKNA